MTDDVTQLMKEVFLTEPEAARVLRIPESTIQNLYRVGKLPGYAVGKHLRFKPEDLRTFAAELEPKK
ncbi:MAG: helix-turn-helix domain-containing protein [Phycisphaerae bacterium]